MLKGSLKEKENNIRNLLEEERQKLEKKSSGYLSKKKDPLVEYQRLYPQNVLQTVKTTANYSRDKRL